MLIAAETSFNWASLIRPEILVFLVGGLVGAIYIICATVRSVLADRENARLKADMIERGFSADEIARVVEAGKDADAEDQTAVDPSATPNADTLPSKA